MCSVFKQYVPTCVELLHILSRDMNSEKPAGY